MANFTTHIAVGTVASGMLATLTMAANVVTPQEVLTLTAAGALGSVLPDIDLDKSRPSQALFSGLGVFLAFAILFNVGWKLSVAEMWIVWGAVFLFVRFGGEQIFHRLSYHRGIFHSVLAAVFFSFVTAAVYWWLFKTPDTIAWLAGVFTFVGYLVHLTLDEMYSVDVLDQRVKASFGTALKFIDTRKPWHSLEMAIATVAAYFATPSTATFFKIWATPDIWAFLHKRLLPEGGKWFAFLTDLTHLASQAPQ